MGRNLTVSPSSPCGCQHCRACVLYALKAALKLLATLPAEVRAAVLAEALATVPAEEKP